MCVGCTMSGGSSSRETEIAGCSLAGSRRAYSSVGGTSRGVRIGCGAGLARLVGCMRSALDRGGLVGGSCQNYFCSSCLERTFNERFQTAYTCGFHDASTQQHHGVRNHSQHSPLLNATKYRSHDLHETHVSIHPIHYHQCNS